jgi:hypothetical protein
VGCAKAAARVAPQSAARSAVRQKRPACMGSLAAPTRRSAAPALAPFAARQQRPAWTGSASATTQAPCRAVTSASPAKEEQSTLTLAYASVHLVPSCSATAHARSPVRRRQIAQAAILYVPLNEVLIPHAHSVRILLTVAIRVKPPATVLPGGSADSFRWRASVSPRARGSASQGLGAI